MTPTSSAGNSRPHSFERIGAIVMTIVSLGLCCVFSGFLFVTREGYIDRGPGWTPDTERLINALGLYKLDTGTYPESLTALRVKPEGEPKWAGPYLEKDVPLDSWGHAFVYKYSSERSGGPELKSLGSDGIESEDDVLWP